MASYALLKALYSKGTLKLSKKLKLAEGTEVYVQVRPVNSQPRKRRVLKHATKPRKPSAFPTVVLKPGTLAALAGAASLGGDALKDSEALYDAT